VPATQFCQSSAATQFCQSSAATQFCQSSSCECTLPTSLQPTEEHLLCPAVPYEHFSHRLHCAARDAAGAARGGGGRGPDPPTGARAAGWLDGSSRRHRVHRMGGAGAAGIWRRRGAAAVCQREPHRRQACCLSKQDDSQTFVEPRQSRACTLCACPMRMCPPSRIAIAA